MSEVPLSDANVASLFLYLVVTLESVVDASLRSRTGDRTLVGPAAPHRVMSGLPMRSAALRLFVQTWSPPHPWRCFLAHSLGVAHRDRTCDSAVALVAICPAAGARPHLYFCQRSRPLHLVVVSAFRALVPDALGHQTYRFLWMTESLTR